MAKRRPGEWHFLGNDRRSYWRAVRHFEDGVFCGDRDVSGWYWSLERLHADASEDGQRLLERDAVGLITGALDPSEDDWAWAVWDPVEAMLPTRAAALHAYEELAGS